MVTGASCGDSHRWVYVANHSTTTGQIRARRINRCLIRGKGESEYVLIDIGLSRYYTENASMNMLFNMCVSIMLRRAIFIRRMSLWIMMINVQSGIWH